MAFPIVAAIIGALLSGGLAGASSIGRNRAAKSAKDSARRAAELQARQTRDAASIEAAKHLRERQLIRGRTLAAAAESGSPGLAGSFETLLGQNEADAAIDLSIVDANVRARTALIDSQRRAEQARASASIGNPFLDALIGSLQGAQAGASVGLLAKDLFPTNPVPDAALEAGAADALDAGVFIT